MCYFLNPNVTYTLLLTPLVFGTCSFVINGKSVPSLSYVDDLNWSYMFRNPQLATTLSNTYGNGHYAVDIVKYNSNGNNICNGYKMYSVGRGKVVYKDNTSSTGWYVVVKLDCGLTVRYLHMDTQNDVMVNIGDTVTPSTYIGNVGSLGAGSTGPHLHFDINNFDSYYGNNFSASNTYNPQLFFDEI
ncbi:MAG: M23 family metallopeptidase [Oscillospiraceae bacterium]|jgi:murein DD-endopeptidase MepM/ murein hydrolase activator NlpD|nr:M23 family metallopeptidase [Oscillospiraceae bacterium]